MRSLADVYEVDAMERLGSLETGDERRWGAMHVAEMLCHVRGAFAVAMGELETRAEVPKFPLPPRALKFMALQVPVPWPQGVPTLSELRVGAPAMGVRDFAQERVAVVEFMRRFVRPEQVRVDHAMFGAMSYADWMRWGYLHTDHHLRQFGR